MRDGTGHTAQRDTPAKSQPQNQDRYQKAQAEKALQGQLGSLFADTEADSLRADILQAPDRAGVQAAVEAYLAERGPLPAEGELLDRALDVRNDRTLRKVVESVAAALPELDEERRKLLLLKMRVRMRTSFDAKVGKAIKSLLQ